MNLDLVFAFLWIAMGGIHLYRSYSGAMSMGIVTLVTSGPVTISKRSRIGRIFLGIACLSIGVSHLVFYTRFVHH
ncbi:MAG: hypothetical protein JWM83_206 [Candidatus Angelobacter sp.]|nr:hypothetical protein [Candidatus Angelobacter sp.]